MKKPITLMSLLLAGTVGIVGATYAASVRMEVFMSGLPSEESEGIQLKKGQSVIYGMPEGVTIDTDTEEEKVPQTYQILDEYEQYLLARIAMAEAEDEDLEGKALVMNVVLNRVASDEFPDDVESVLFEKKQFAPISNGRWERSDPNNECYEALYMIQDGWDESQGTLYFESFGNDDNWHSNNLEKLFKHGCHTFYK